jgi:hypothetical protein
MRFKYEDIEDANDDCYSMKICQVQLLCKQNESSVVC